MSTTPTVIILAEPLSEDQLRTRADTSGPMAAFSTLDTLLRRVLNADLPMLLVAPPEQADAALTLLPQDDILTLSPPTLLQSRGDWLVRGMAAGIMARSLSPGWIILPADMPMLQARTLQALAQGLSQGPMAYPCHRHLRGHPVAFAGELYSELVRLNSEHDLRRLAARYPAVDVDVDDPGIHLSLESQAGLDQWRAQLAGPHHSLRGQRPIN
ncbi:MAG TPA: NTP transferase domain-containing protein [Aquabacterium sp.]|nr:NTP transferase domain-containing protein [Aquabacterium sp.]